MTTVPPKPGVHSAVISVTASRVEESSTTALFGGVGGDEGLQVEVGDHLGQAGLRPHAPAHRSPRHRVHAGLEADQAVLAHERR